MPVPQGSLFHASLASPCPRGVFPSRWRSPLCCAPAVGHGMSKCRRQGRAFPSQEYSFPEQPDTNQVAPKQQKHAVLGARSLWGGGQGCWAGLRGVCSARPSFWSCSPQGSLAGRPIATGAPWSLEGLVTACFSRSLFLVL